jgi:hypothetical protein
MQNSSLRPFAKIAEPRPLNSPYGSPFEKIVVTVVRSEQL